MPRMDLTGQRFGRLCVIGLSHVENGRTFWTCVCDCNPDKEVVIKGKYLTNGDTKSCGCLSVELIRQIGKNNKKHNSYRIEQNLVYVTFSNCQEEFLCDLCDWNEATKRICWHKNNTGYARGQINEQMVLFHDYIFDIDTTTNIEIDHIDGNRLNNTRKNLRRCVRQNNSYNKGIYSNNTSGVTGVSFHKLTQKWSATINYNKQTINLGLFDNFYDAVKARKDAENKYFKEWKRQK